MSLITVVTLQTTVLETVSEGTHFVEELFGLKVSSQVTCGICGKSSEPRVSSSYFFLSYVASLWEVAHHADRLTFGQILQKANDEDVRSCPDEVRRFFLLDSHSGLSFFALF